MKLTAYTLALRPQFWIASLCPAIAGYIISLTINNSLFSLPLFLGLLFIFGPGIAGASEAFNDYFDREYDKAKNVKRCGKIPFSGGSGLIQILSLNPKEILWLSLFLFSVSLLLTFKTNLLYFLLIILGIFLAIGYSAPPLRFKNKGILGPISIAIGYGTIPFYAGFLIVQPYIPVNYIFLGALLGILSFGLQGVPDLMDFKDDKRYGIKTFPVQVNSRNAAVVYSICQVSPFILLVILYLFNVVKVSYVNFLFWIIFTFMVLLSFCTVKYYDIPQKLSKLYLFSFVGAFSAFIFV